MFFGVLDRQKTRLRDEIAATEETPACSTYSGTITACRSPGIQRLPRPSGTRVHPTARDACRSSDLSEPRIPAEFGPLRFHDFSNRIFYGWKLLIDAHGNASSRKMRQAANVEFRYRERLETVEGATGTHYNNPAPLTELSSASRYLARLPYRMVIGRSAGSLNIASRRIFFTAPQFSQIFFHAANRLQHVKSRA